MDQEKENQIGKITEREITAELKEAYLDYAMSVIVGRALPDARDGLKPVQRRILWAMWDMGLSAGAKFMKAARVTGECLGKYHPHGDVAVYDAMVRMAQDFSLRYPLIQGQGNFGSIDGDPPAAQRYTEARLSKISEELLSDIEKETTDWQPNYDATRLEPIVLPAKLPNLLVNGASGIAVGMATNIPPHNLSEVVDAEVCLIDRPEASLEELTDLVKGPDFPTGGIIYDKKAIAAAYAAGKGSITCRAVADVEEKRIVITEIPYQVNKSELIVKMAELVQEKRVEGIKDIRDESDKDGLRIVIELKSDAVPQKVLNQLYKFTDLQKDFHLNTLALVDGIRAEVMSLKDMLSVHIKHRENVVRRRAEFDLKRAKERAHILEGLAKALSVIDKIIATIKKSDDKEDAKKNLVKNFDLSELQAEAILEMKLQTLAALEREKIENELKEKKKLIADLEALLKSPKAILKVVKEELVALKEKYGDERKTKVVASGLKEFSDEDLIPEEEVMITLSKSGYIKRLPPQNIKAQHRGGKGVIGSDVGEDDFLTHFISAATHDNILFFTEKGRAFQIKVYEIPAASRTAKGRMIQNFLEIPADESVNAVITYSNSQLKSGSGYLVMVTSKGVIKKTSIKEFGNIRRNGIIAINLNKGDKLIGAKLSSGKDEIVITTVEGQAIRFKETEARAMGRAAAGVRGINLSSSDKVASFDIVPAEKKSANLLSVMDNGFAKQTPLKEYKVQSRGGKGIKTATITSKTGKLVTSQVVSDETELIALSAKGQILRTEIKSVRETARAAQGVRIIKLDSGDKLIGIICL
ncbi:MAG: DNA gyrase subunit A [Patescibacteria group bacterium]|nr:DNA gyrase subunit A [Patescibacteria group bacterium]MCL5262184.1 DNA gyrase subunit A [Patescibacteria group bacterium]